LVITVGVQAQNYKVTSGVVQYNNREFADAFKSLDEALQDASKISPKNLPKAYFYRAKARIGMLQLAAASGNQAELEKMGIETPMLAAADYKKALETDAAGKWTKKIKAEQAGLRVSLLQGGIQAINEIYKNPNLPEADKNEAFKVTVKLMDLANEIEASYLGYDIAGQAQLGMKDSTAALASFNKATELFTQTKAPSPDISAAYMYYRIAVIERYSTKNLDNALAAITGGIAAADGEFKRYEEMVASGKIQANANTPKQYDGTKKDLKAFELDIYLNAPDKLQEALAKFEKGIQENPKDYMIHVAYANLLEKTDAEKARTIYQKAIDIDPDKEIAHFNLGAMYTNSAAEKSKEANETNDMKKYDQLKAEIDELLKKSIPHLEAALKANPKSRPTLTALKQAHVSLNNMDEYTKYKKMLDEL